jgi:hypothetical protein
MSLEENLISTTWVILSAEEVVETNVLERSR